MTPSGEETLVRLACWMPYAQACEELQELVGMQVSKATARRMTLATGEAALEVCEAEVEQLKQEVPQAPGGAAKQALSGDGAMVHLLQRCSKRLSPGRNRSVDPRLLFLHSILSHGSMFLRTAVGGEWSEVKTLALGEVTRNKRGEVCTQHLSSFSRLCEAASFEEAALVETYRRALEGATAVCAVQVGAAWLQGLVDYHRADAVRILDFAHAAEYINEIGQAVQAAGGSLPAGWLQAVLHRLKHQGPHRVHTHLTWLATRYPSQLMQEKLTYLRDPLGAHAVSRLSASGLAHWFGQCGKCQQIGRRGTARRRWHGASSERTPIACWCCAMRSAVDAGTRPGGQRERSGRVDGKPRARSG